MCGVFALSQANEAAKLTFLGLFALQHRGQESAGITVVNPNGQLVTHKGVGLVSDVFNPEKLEKLGGTASVGHVRYSTAGGGADANIQPLTARIAKEPVAIVHNGNIVNSHELREELEDSGSILQGTADTEIMLHLMARCRNTSFTNRFAEAAALVEGALTSVLLTQHEMLGYVDPLGYRPLVIGKLGEGWVLSSESCGLDLVGASFERDVRPGELVRIDLKTQELHSSFPGEARAKEKQTPSQSRRARCVFEHIYFGRPDSFLWGQSSTVKRTELGAALAQKAPVEADLVMAIPDSGVPIAMGYASESGIPYRVGLIRNHYVGRTFIEPAQNVRNFRVRLKLNPVKEVVRGKRVVVVDDSIVRGTTSRHIIELLREVGATEVHVRIGSPRVSFPCYYGIDTPKRRELLAQSFDTEAMREFLGADTLAFLDEERLTEVMNQGLEGANQQEQNWCTACFSGTYQDRFAQRASQTDGPGGSESKRGEEHGRN